MPTLNDARQALDAARATLQAARSAESAARTEVEAIRTRIADGDRQATSSALAAATAEVEHASLAATGAERGVADLSAAVRAAEVDATCDAILAGLPVRGSAVRGALEGVLDALAPFVAAAAAYDDFVEQSTNEVGLRAHDLSARVTVPRHGSPTIDHRRLESCRGPSQLADVILPAMRALGAPATVIADLKLMAAGAPDLPTL